MSVLLKNQDNQIALSTIMKLDSLNDYKVHFAKFNGHVHPKNSFARGIKEWQSWQEYMPDRDDFNRKMIFSLCELDGSRWLFGGIWNVDHRDFTKKKDQGYTVSLSDQYKNFIGRLIIKYEYKDRSTRVKLESHFDNFIVSEILEEQYSGIDFPGFHQINISFDDLCTIVKNNRTDWKAPLSNIKGIYLISNRENGKLYIGSAYGESGIWGRWSDYAQSGHGGNKALKEVFETLGENNYKQTFFITLLEAIPFNTEDSFAIKREGFWKQLFSTRGVNGYNEN